MADATITAIQAINASIGLNAPVAMPPAITAQMLPCAITFIGHMGGSGKFSETTYVSLVMIAFASAGVNPDPIFVSSTAFLKAMRDVYRGVGSVNGYATLKQNPTANGGFGSPYGMTRLQAYGGTEFYGFAWHCTLLENT